MLITFNPTVMLSKEYSWSYTIDYSLYRYDKYNNGISAKYDINIIRRK